MSDGYAKNPATVPTPPASMPMSPDEKARVSLSPALNTAIVVNAYQANLLGDEISLPGLVEGLSASMDRSKGGDLSTMEAMLIGQATALQTMFASLAKRAAHQEQLRHYETFLTLALKAQAQSRATISALVDLKYPRQATFVKQANIAHGPQQVNNGAAPAHGEEAQPQQNKLLEADHGQPGGWMDTRAATTATRGNPAVEAVVKVNRAKKPRG